MKSKASNMSYKKHIELLGYKVKDKVTGIEGVVTSVCFYLYGCIQASFSYSKDNEHKSSSWLDVTRLEIISDDPVMELPDFDKGYIAEGNKGPAQKPLR